MDAIHKTSDVFAALSDSNRLAIMEMLSVRGPMSSGDISAEFAISAPAISHHLKVLRNARVVTVRKERQRRVYRIDGRTIGFVEGWAQEIHRRLQSRYDTLEQIIHEEI